MHILVCNDDGVFAPGIRALASALSEIAKVTIVAPDRNRSGASNSLTLASPLTIKNLEQNIIAVEGTPTDCAHLALTGLLEDKPDMVVSGINEHANLGDDVWYSGTVAAAMEGRFLGYPALAISLVGEEHYATAAEVAKKLVLQLIADPLSAGTILNVNVPDIPLDALQGYEVTRLGTRHAAEPIIKETDPRGRPIYWVGPPGLQADAGEGTDFYAVESAKVSMTPLQTDITHYKAFDTVASWVNKLTS